MRQSYLVVAAWMVGLAMGSSAALGQNDPGRIAGSALGAQGSVSEKDQTQIVAYIEFWVKQLLSGNPETIATARGRLIELYGQGGTETFISYYDQNLATRIAAGLGAKDVAGRLNTMIVARYIRHERVADVVKAGLKDPSSAVSYQAAVAAESLVKNAKTAPAVKLGLRLPVMEALKKENSSYVLNFLYGALIAIDDPAGWDAALAKMNERLATHVAQENAGIDAEAEGLKALYNRLVRAGGSDSSIKIADKTIHLFTLVCVRYMDYALNKASADEATTQLIDTCDFGSNWAADRLAKAGAKITVPARMKDKPTADEKRLMLTYWREILVAEPFKFAPAEVALPAKK